MLGYMNQHTIQLSRKKQEALQDIVRRGRHQARVITRARILLLSHNGEGKDAMARHLEIGRSTVPRVRDRYREGGLERALYDAPRPGRAPKLDDHAEAHLVAMACSDSPEGRDHWTLELLQERMMADNKVDTISTVAIWKHLKKRGIKPWRENNVGPSEPHACVH
jgi:transposase